jgi:hypothetical protein
MEDNYNFSTFEEIDEEEEIDEDNKLENEKSKHKNCKYKPNTIFWIRVIYVIAIVLWLFLIIYTKFYTLKAAFILSIPFIIFTISMINASELSTEVEDYMFAANFLTIGLLLALPLLNWTSKGYSGDKNLFTLIIVLAITLSIISMYDFWIPKKWLSVYKHYRSCLETLSLTLVIFGLIEYFLCREGLVLESNH